MGSWEEEVRALCEDLNGSAVRKRQDALKNIPGLLKAQQNATFRQRTTDALNGKPG